VSGSNTDAKLGDDMIDSGTVSAATVGRHLGLPAIAGSLVNNGHFHDETAARLVRLLLELKRHLDLNPRPTLNVTVPALHRSELAGIQVTWLGHRDRAEGVVPVTCPRGKRRYWIGAAGGGGDAGPGTDFHAVQNGFVSVTPVHIDMTRHEAMSRLQDWVDDLEGFGEVSQ